MFRSSSKCRKFTLYKAENNCWRKSTVIFDSARGFHHFYGQPTILKKRKKYDTVIYETVYCLQHIFEFSILSTWYLLQMEEKTKQTTIWMLRYILDWSSVSAHTSDFCVLIWLERQSYMSKSWKLLVADSKIQTKMKIEIVMSFDAWIVFSLTRITTE